MQLAIGAYAVRYAKPLLLYSTDELYLGSHVEVPNRQQYFPFRLSYIFLLALHVRWSSYIVQLVFYILSCNACLICFPILSFMSYVPSWPCLINKLS
jgi:hypothetical protein